jgi:hypothetical protein
MKFRPAALRQLEAPEKLDEVVRLATAPAWLMGAALAIIVAAAATWASLGTVATAVGAPGVLVHADGVSAPRAVVFVPAAAAPTIRTGSDVTLTAAAAPSAVFGTLRGTVASVGTFTETSQSLQAFLGQDASTSTYLSAGNVIRVVIALTTVPGSPAKLAWSKANPGYTLSAESSVQASFVVAREHPMNWLINR